MGIKDWFRERRVDPDPASKFDQELQEDREQAEQAVTTSRTDAQRVETLKDKSGKVHQGMSGLREDNHFGPWLFRALRGSHQ